MTAKTINMDVSSLDRLAKELAKYPIHAQDSLQKGLGEGKKALLKTLPPAASSEYSILPGQVRRSLQSRGVRRVAKGASFGLEVRGPGLNLASFSHYPTVPQGRQGIPMVAVRRGPFQMLRPRQGEDGRLKPAFLARNGNRADSRYIYFRRTGVLRIGKSREKITAIQSVSIPQMVQNPRVEGPVLSAVNGAVDNKMNRELDSLLSRMKGAVEE